MKLIIIILPIIILNSYVNANNLRIETLYVLGDYPNWKWTKFGKNKTQQMYQGQVKDGKPNGHGVLVSPNGWKFFGSWKSGKIWNGNEYDNFGNIIFRWLEGKRKYHNLHRSY